MPKVLAIVLAVTVFGCELGPSEPVDEASVPTAAPPPATATSTATLPPTPGPSAVGHVVIPFEWDPAGRATTVAIVDEAGALAEWRPATPGELRQVQWNGRVDAGLGALSRREVVLAWIATICDREATLTVEPTRLVIDPAPREGCDAMAIGRGLVLTYGSPVDPGTIEAVLMPTDLLPEDDD